MPCPAARSIPRKAAPSPGRRQQRARQDRCPSGPSRRRPAQTTDRSHPSPDGYRPAHTHRPAQPEPQPERPPVQLSPRVRPPTPPRARSSPPPRSGPRREPEPVDPITVHGQPCSRGSDTPNRQNLLGNQSYTNQPTPLSVHSRPGHLQTPDLRTSSIRTALPAASPRAGSRPHHRRRHVFHTKPIPLQAIPPDRSRERALSCGLIHRGAASRRVRTCPAYRVPLPARGRESVLVLLEDRGARSFVRSWELVSCGRPSGCTRCSTRDVTVAGVRGCGKGPRESFPRPLPGGAASGQALTRRCCGVRRRPACCCRCARRRRVRRGRRFPW